MFDECDGCYASGESADEVGEYFRYAVNAVAEDAQNDCMKVGGEWCCACGGVLSECFSYEVAECCTDDGGVPCDDEDCSCAEEEGEDDAEDEYFYVVREDVEK